MRKIIFVLLLLIFFIFATRGEVRAYYCTDAPFNPSPGDRQTGVSIIGPLPLQWKKPCVGVNHYRIILYGPGYRIDNKCIDDASSTAEYEIPAGNLSSGINGCKYHWKVQGWTTNDCTGDENKHTKWSPLWSFTTVTSTNECPSTPGAPGVIYTKPIECCKLKYNFTDVDENCEEESVVADPDYRNCQWTVDATTTRWSVCCFLNTLYKISDWLTWLVLPFAILVSLAGAWTLTTSGGDPQKVNKGRDYIIWALVGAVVCFFIKAILAIIKMIV